MRNFSMVILLQESKERANRKLGVQDSNEPTMKNWKLLTLFKSPLGVVFALGLLIMLVELLIMSVINAPFISKHLSGVGSNLVDSILLTLIISPVLYSLVFKRLKSDELLRQINASAQEAIVVVDEQGRITDWNPAAQRNFQYTREEAIGKQLHPLLAPSHYHTDAARGFADFQKTGKGPLIGIINEVTAIRKDGSEFPVELSVTGFKVKGGWQAVGVMRDISARKKLEQDREQYLKFFMLSINPMCIADPYGCFTQANPAFVKLTGYSESELIAKPFLDFVLPEDRQRTEDEMKLQVETRPTLYFENRYLCKDGGVIDLSWTAYYDKHDGITYATAIDTTERKRTEEMLRKLSQAVEQSPSAIAITDLKANIEYVNEGFVRTSGYSRTELVGHNPRLLQSGKTPRASYTDMWAHLLRGEMWKGEFTNRRKDGSEYIEYVLASPVRQADGRVTHYLTIKEDITQLKHAQQALQASNENLHRLLNSMAEGAYGVDINGDCTFVNRAFLQILGYQNEAEVLGKRTHGLIHHSHADGRPYPANECLAYCAFRHDRAINVSDEVFWRKDGVAVPVEYWSYPIESDGATIGSIVTFIDITERKQAEAVLREKDILLSDSQRIAQVGSWRYEISGHISWSDEMYHLFGVSPDTFTPNPESFFSCIHPDDRPSMQTWLDECVAGKKPDALEFRILLSDGTVRFINGFGDLQCDAENRPLYLTGMSQDITERKQAEAELSEQMDELRRWHEVTSGREARILELKHEVNELMGQIGNHPRYPSAESANPTET
jgi:PAS domain S-box-containing protein